MLVFFVIEEVYESSKTFYLLNFTIRENLSDYDQYPVQVKRIRQKRIYSSDLSLCVKFSLRILNVQSKRLHCLRDTVLCSKMIVRK